MKPDLIQAFVPLFLGFIGGIIGVAVLVSPDISDAKAAAGFGVAASAIAGAAGLSQNAKKD